VRSPAAAIGWEILSRHRWGLGAVAAYLLALATYRLVILDASPQVSFDDHKSFAFAVMVPISITFMYLLAVFAYGPAGDLAGRASIYPARMFTLPLTSAALAGWPMLYGATLMALLWPVARAFAVWPSDFEPPLLWPGLLCAAILTWTQALTWMPYPLRGMRVAVALLLLVTLDAVVILALETGASERLMVALLAPHPALAFLVARRAVARARRGDVPDWSASVARLDRTAGLTPRRFESAAHALRWLEWRRFGRSLPLLVGLILPFELLLLIPFAETPSVVRATLLAVLLTPPFMAGFAAASVSRSRPGGRDAYDLPPFLAALPVTSVAMVSARLRVAMRSALAAWAIVVAAVPLGLLLSGTAAIVLDDGRRVVELFGVPRALAMAGVVAFLAALSTWKRLVSAVLMGVSGRAWLVKGSVFGSLLVVTLAFVLAPWLIQRHVIAGVLHALPWILGVLASCKVVAAAWVAVRLHGARLVSGRALVLGALWWDTGVFLSFILLLCLVPPLLFRVYGLGLVAILLIPLVRVAGAPLALAWNRHR
jgi:hypothetical protein